MTGDMEMIYNHAIFSLCTMTGFLALVLSVSLFCKSIAEAKEWNPVMRLHLEVLERVLGGGKNHERGIRRQERRSRWIEDEQNGKTKNDCLP